MCCTMPDWAPDFRHDDGDLARGHDALDHFVKMIRKRNIKTLRNLPGPKVD
jgi:hypothetical protein